MKDLKDIISAEINNVNEAEKIVYIVSSHKGHKTIYGDTLKNLINGAFRYTLECGNSWNSKIPVNPKTVKALVKALNMSAYECNRYYDVYDEASKEDIVYFKNHSDGSNSVLIN